MVRDWLMEGARGLATVCNSRALTVLLEHYVVPAKETRGSTVLVKFCCMLGTTRLAGRGAQRPHVSTPDLACPCATPPVSWQDPMCEVGAHGS